MHVSIGGRAIGEGKPCYIIGEIGINHNGSVDIARRLIDVAADSGCDAVKFQKRTPELAVPAEQRNLMRETPWGTMSYMDYRIRMEFGADEYAAIAAHCEQRDIHWFTSCWDVGAVAFMESFNPLCYKIASASLTDRALLQAVRDTGRPVLLSTGMSSLEQIRDAVGLLRMDALVLMHTTSTYPCPPAELNLRVIDALRREFGLPVGYSGHEVGLQTTVAAVVLGACCVERHITLDRAMWGSDQAASIEPQGLERLVRDIRVVEEAMGDGRKRVYDSELPALKRLRRTATP